jgi:regulatory protein
MSWNNIPKQDLAGEPAKVRAAALRYLGRREYTAVELRRRLAERGATATDIEAVLEYLQGRGYQDDARAAESHIRQRLQYAPRGRALVRQELKARGLAAELCAAMLDEHYPPEMERKLLQRLLSKEAQPEQARHEQDQLEQTQTVQSQLEQTQLEQTQLEQAQLGQTQLDVEPLSRGFVHKARRLRQKIARRLLAKGFSQSLVIEALEEWLPPVEDSNFMD